jgi:hypothetical protein
VWCQSHTRTARDPGPQPGRRRSGRERLSLHGGRVSRLAKGSRWARQSAIGSETSRRERSVNRNAIARLDVRWWESVRPPKKGAPAGRAGRHAG